MPQSDQQKSRKRSSATAALTSDSQADIEETRTRKKRNRYTPHACNRCKAAKVRCDGRLPCSYCSTRDAETCNYSAVALPTFQTEVDTVNNESHIEQKISEVLARQNEKLDLLIKRTEMFDPVHGFSLGGQAHCGSRLLPSKRSLPLFQSATSAFCCINIIGGPINTHHSNSHDNAAYLSSVPLVPRSSFSIIRGRIVEGETSDLDSRDDASDAPNPLLQADDHIHYSNFASFHPLDELEDSQMSQMLNEFEAMIACTYPIHDIADLKQKMGNYLRSRQSSPTKGLADADVTMLEENDITMLKLVMAICLLGQGHEHKDLASRLFQSTQADVQAKVWDAMVDLKDLGLLILVVFYHLHRGSWRLGWRFLGNISRVVYELGLNREIVLARLFPEWENRRRALNTVWTVYVLEQHLTYALGHPNVMQGLHIESSFPRPINAPFLSAMIEYSQIGREACSALLNDTAVVGGNCNIWQSSYTSFQYRIERWALETMTKIQDPLAYNTTDPSRRYMATLIRLRANLIRILVARVFICTELRMSAPSEIWSRSVHTAADTVQVLSGLDRSSKEYRFHRPQLNHFLISALDLLLFVCSSAHSDYEKSPEISISSDTSTTARQAAMVALNVLRDLAEVCDHSKSLWEKTKAIASRINLTSWLFEHGSIIRNGQQHLQTEPQSAPGGLRDDSLFTSELEDPSRQNTVDQPSSAVDDFTSILNDLTSEAAFDSLQTSFNIPGDFWAGSG
ncbi:hypothetical protein PV08_08176 [Exophiala spinifera]|uniref:Zn(2)-C6 fungal-type domain-containing protein n=1 Tax=Exophiala spinifera TaxID=91928 RepID=A0A0D2BPI7_9EURO|nr:uncharacterized protein PV08_08176 [Exophiala spinifera]KIW12989.1 hypothetical protein PV08_08176 [Exophiala spinifera]